MATTDVQKIILGSGTVYIAAFTKGTAIPPDATIEVETNLLGLISGGASLTYKPKFYQASDDTGEATKIRLTKEEVTMKSGVITWNGNTLAKLCSTARVSEDDTAHIRTVKIGGLANDNGLIYLLRFLQKDPVDGDLRVTIVGRNQSDFTLAFVKDKETTVDAEFTAQPIDSDGTLIIFTETIPAAS